MNALLSILPLIDDLKYLVGYKLLPYYENLIMNELLVNCKTKCHCKCINWETIDKLCSISSDNYPFCSVCDGRAALEALKYFVN